MLVLSRKLNESIVIANNIVVTVVDIDRGKIRIGIEAPPDIAIYRKELVAEGEEPPPHVPRPKRVLGR